MLQRLCSQDYRALVAMSANAPPITLFGRGWAPGALSTWIVPAGLLTAGGLIAWCALRRLRGLAQKADQPLAPVVTVAEQVRP
jgi:branched-chain amino acid transport system permease protein